MTRGFRIAFKAAIILIAIVAAVLIASVILWLIGAKVGATFYTICIMPLTRSLHITEILIRAIPLAITAIGVSVAYRSGIINIGAEGQITMGAVFASYFALYWVNSIPRVPLLIIMCLTAAIAGGLWALIPAFFKAKWNTNETLFTLMMNYIAIGIVAWLQGGPWEGRKGSQLIPMFANSARLPTVFGVNCGWIIVLALVIFMYIYMNKTKHGYEIAVIGDSVNTARYAGMNVGWIMMRTMFLSGAISGIVGFIIVSGANFTLYSGVANGVGFTSITVAWLSQLNSFAMIIISMILAVLEKGANTLQTRLDVPASISDIITGILLFCMLSSEFFINYRLIFRHKERKEAEA